MPRAADSAKRFLDALQSRLRPELFQALCDPVRVALVARLAAEGRPLTVTEVSGCCGIHFSGVSRHLAILKRAGVVRAERRGREVHYALEAPALATTLRELADSLEATWENAERHAAGASR